MISACPFRKPATRTSAIPHKYSNDVFYYGKCQCEIALEDDSSVEVYGTESIQEGRCVHASWLEPIEE